MSRENNSVNPYAPPAEPGRLPAEPITFEEALRRIQRPARVLVYTSAVNIVANFTILPMLFFYDSINTSAAEAPPLVVAILVACAAIGLPLVALVGALRVGRKRPVLWSWIATVAALIPLGTGCWFLQLPFAFWLLRLLVKPEIRAALHQSPA